jgi:hypothetical protein
MFRSAMLKLKLVCCCAASVSCSVNCGTICGGSNLAGLLGPEGALGTRGRAGELFTTINGEGGGAASSSNSGEASVTCSSGELPVFGKIGLADAIAPQGKLFALALTVRSAQPPQTTDAMHRPASHTRG